jgi:hypothetical protein
MCGTLNSGCRLSAHSAWAGTGLDWAHYYWEEQLGNLEVRVSSACIKTEGLKDCSTGSGSPGEATVFKYGWKGCGSWA